MMMEPCWDWVRVRDSERFELEVEGGGPDLRDRCDKDRCGKDLRLALDEKLVVVDE